MELVAADSKRANVVWTIVVQPVQTVTSTVNFGKKAIVLKRIATDTMGLAWVGRSRECITLPNSQNT